MVKRSNLILGIGIAVFVIGAGATFLVLRSDDGGGGTAAASPGQSSVLYAAKAIPSGMSGVQAVEQGYVKTRSVDVSRKPAGALGNPTELSGKSAQGSVPEGTVITGSQFAAKQTALGSVKIPDGKTALALSMTPPQGVAGQVAAGDRVDVYGVLKEGPGAPAAKLILQNIEVLSTGPSGGAVAAASTAATPSTAAVAGAPTYLVALTTLEAERCVFYTSFGELYFSLVSKDAPAGPDTPGSHQGNVLDQLS